MYNNAIGRARGLAGLAAPNVRRESRRGHSIVFYHIILCWYAIYIYIYVCIHTIMCIYVYIIYIYIYIYIERERDIDISVRKRFGSVRF